MRGCLGGWPGLLDKSYDAVAWVGQHAKAGTEYAHLPHTQDFNYLDLSINGISIGEFGQLAMCASELEIPAIFASGDEAFTKEAKVLIPTIEVVSVKKGTTPGKGDELPKQAYSQRNLSAIHLHPVKARELIREGALKAITRKKKGEVRGVIDLKPPFERITLFRSDANAPKTISRENHPKSVSALLNLPFEIKPAK